MFKIDPRRSPALFEPMSAACAASPREAAKLAGEQRRLAGNTGEEAVRYGRRLPKTVGAFDKKKAQKFSWRGKKSDCRHGC
jgi:hypothetical protein